MITFQQVTGTGKGFCLQEITFELEPGYVLGITGENGAGKSTLLRYIVDPETRYTGKISINGREITNEHRVYMNEIGYIAEDAVFQMAWTGLENARLYKTVYKNWHMKVFEEYMKQFDLSIYRSIQFFSRGEFMQFQLAFALAHDAKVLLLDEATAGMDPVFRREFFQLLRSLLESGERTVIMTTQLMEELESHCDYVMILQNGRMVSYEEAI